MTCSRCHRRKAILAGRCAHCISAAMNAQHARGDTNPVPKDDSAALRALRMSARVNGDLLSDTAQ